jgi:HPt (histidine-containing phosphotransfer) domain-containing protein
MDDFLSKPLHREELEQTVQRWLSVARERSAYREPSSLAGSLRQLIADTDEDFVRQIVGTFARTGAELAAKATMEWRAGNRAATVRAIHSLKGAAGTLGAHDLMSACAAWERRADEGTLTEDDLRRLEKLAETTISAVQEGLKSLWEEGERHRP